MGYSLTDETSLVNDCEWAICDAVDEVPGGATSERMANASGNEG